MLIREERWGDQALIAGITARAFAHAKHGGQTEPAIIEKLRASGDLAISLVAVASDALVGHVAISPVAIGGVHHGWFGLGPVSVEPAYQAQGIGSALIRSSLERLRFKNAAGCVVLGNPTFYRRFGFERTDRLRFEGAPAEYFLCLHLTAHEPPSGPVTYASGFN